MTDRLIAYLLDGLSHDERVEVEAHLLIDANWRAELERLQTCLADTGDPLRCKDEPPRDLVRKTCKLVEESGDDLKPVHIGSGAMSPAGACGGARSRWSMGDVAVAAGVMLALGSLFLPTLRGARDGSRRLACQDNLRWIGTHLFDYQERHQHEIPATSATQNAGMFALELVKRGGVDPDQMAQHLVCPESNQAPEPTNELLIVFRDPSRLNVAVASMRIRIAKSMGGSYTYPLGYTSKDGGFHQLGFTGSPELLLMSDAPQIVPNGVRITSHAGRGQNVLDQSMSVHFRSTCTMPGRDDNIFLNDDGKHAAGCNVDDIVLGRSEYGPRGPVVPVSGEPPNDRLTKNQ